MTTIATAPKLISKRQVLVTSAIILGFSYLATILFPLPAPLAFTMTAQIILFILLFRRPVWAVASLIVGQFTSPDFMIAYSGETMISVRLIWTAMALALLIPILKARKGTRFGSRAGRILIPVILFFVIATVANFVNVGQTYVIQYLRQISSSVIILILSAAVVEKEKDLAILGAVALITCSISGFFAILQHYGISLSLLDRTAMYGGQSMWGTRALGFTESPVDLGYNLPLVILPLMSMIFFRTFQSRTRKIMILLGLIMMLGLYFSYTRSGLYALAPGIIAMLLLMKRSKGRKQLLFLVLVAAIAFTGFFTLRASRFTQGFKDDDSAAARLVLWEAGAKIAMDYPLFGVGYYRFQELSLAYKSSLDVENLATKDAGDVLGEDAPHNDFIRVWLSFGTPAFLVFIWLFISILRNFLEAYRWASSRFLQSFSLGCFAALMSYIVNALTHNMMDTVFYLWIFGGLSIACCRLAATKPPDKIKVVQ